MHVHVHVNTHEWTYTQNYRQARRCIILYAPTGSLGLMLTGDILQVQHILDELNNTGIGYREIHADSSTNTLHTPSLYLLDISVTIRQG